MDTAHVVYYISGQFVGFCIERMERCQYENKDNNYRWDYNYYRIGDIGWIWKCTASVSWRIQV